MTIKEAIKIFGQRDGIKLYKLLNSKCQTICSLIVEKFRLTTGAANGSVLVSDAEGNGTWQSLNSLGWALTGNSGTNPTINFLGTTDAKDLVLKTNNIERVRILSGGNISVINKLTTSTLQITTGSSVNSVLVSDALGNGSWSSLNTLAWRLNGNSGINPTNDFIGTTDNQNLIFRVNNIESFRIFSSTRNIGINTTTDAGFRLDVNGTGSFVATGTLSTDIGLRVRNSTNTFNILEVRGDGNIQIGSDSIGATRSTTIAAANFSRLVLDTIYTADTAVLSVSRRYSATVGRLSDNALILSHNFFADGGSVPYKMHFVNPSNYYGAVVANDGYNAGFMWFKDSSNIANLQMKLSPDNALNIYNSTNLPIETNYVDSFQIYSRDITAGNAAPHFRTELGHVIKLYRQDLPTNPTNAEIATLLSNVGLANLI